MLAVAGVVADASVNWVGDTVRSQLPWLDSTRLVKLLKRLLFLDSNHKCYYSSAEAYGAEQQAAYKLLSDEVRTAAACWNQS